LFYRRQFYRTPAWRRHRAATQGTLTIRHVDNTGDRVKFRHSTEPPAIMLRNKPRRKARENSMAPAEGPTSPENPHEKPSHEKASQEKASDQKASDQKASDQKAWHEVVLETFKRNDIRLVPYVPDRVLTTLIRKLHADPFFTTFPTAREEEAVGIVSGAWMGGMRGAVLMQTSGFATLANVLASLALPYQIPLIMLVSERGTLGEFNYGQSLVCRTMRPVLDSLAMEHHTATRLDEFEFIVDRSIKQAIATQAPVALILSPLLTGGKIFEK
jgi:sulfopyruvate decarboxylase alpha subunit